MKEASAQISWSLDIECPECEIEFDLSEFDSDNLFGNAIFENRWEDVKGQEVCCPECNSEFKVKEIEY